jgi:hypothetical protein
MKSEGHGSQEFDGGTKGRAVPCFMTTPARDRN